MQTYVVKMTGSRLPTVFEVTSLDELASEVKMWDEWAGYELVWAAKSTVIGGTPDHPRTRDVRFTVQEMADLFVLIESVEAVPEPRYI